jgi:hypothetical protein
MKTLPTSIVAFLAALFLIATPSAMAQRHGEGGGGHAPGGGGHFPAGPPRGPAPARAAPARPAPAVRAAPEPARGGPPARAERPHVEPNARWVGHDGGRGDARYHVDHPWARGRFAGPIGRGHTYRLGGWEPGRHRFFFGSSFFVLAAADWAYADDWDWNGDQIVLYDDPDHPGYYLAYNTRLGTYVHVTYDGGPG